MGEVVDRRLSSLAKAHAQDAGATDKGSNDRD